MCALRQFVGSVACSKLALALALCSFTFPILQEPAPRIPQSNLRDFKKYDVIWPSFDDDMKFPWERYWMLEPPSPVNDGREQDCKSLGPFNKVQSTPRSISSNIENQGPIFFGDEVSKTFELRPSFARPQ